MNPGPCESPEQRPASDHHLAEVVSVKDVGSTGRIQVRVYGYDGPASQNAVLTARLCVPFAGDARGAFFVPDVGDEVVVAFLNGDARQAIVLGAVWNGKNKPAEQLGGGGNSVDRWSFVGKSGTRVAIVEESGGAKIRLSAAQSGSEIATCELDTQGGGKIELKAGGTTLRLDSQGVHIETSGQLVIQASDSSVTSPTINVTAGQTMFSGQVTANMVQTPSVVGASYTPGAGNIW
jgi:uncharacterized protein involved in type VI secretion and phage assembly